MTDPRDRRAEKRRDVVLDCALEVIGPPDFTGGGPMQGHTVNMTEHGLMVAIPGVTQQTADRWQHAVEIDRVILVQAQLAAYPQLPFLKGQICWTNFVDDPDEGPVCYLGLLFQILGDREMEILQKILAGLATEPD